MNSLISRRGFIGGSLAAFLLQPARFAFALAPESLPDFTSFVNVMIGTGGHGHTYPGATVPFGAVQLSPDTGTRGWDHCSGYHADDTSLIGFSHTHLSGTGCGDLLDFLIRPARGSVKLNDRIPFSHADEKAEPGFYSVALKDRGVLAELTATERVGFHRYTFPAGTDHHFLFDLAHRYEENNNEILWSELKVIGHDTLVGGRSVGAWASGRILYFALRVSKPFDRVTLFSDGREVKNPPLELKGQNLQAALHFATAANEAVLVKVGISSVSPEGALKNLETEIPDWNFDRVRLAAKTEWQSKLSRIKVETQDSRLKQIFYTGLYHSMLAPTLFDDVDGQYRGMDGNVHRLSAGSHNYSTYSLWDTFRAVHPLYTLCLADRVPDFVNSLIRMANESPAGLPVWPLQGKETACMTGYHSASVIAEALVKGFKGIDFKSAYGPMKRRSFSDDYEGLSLYRTYGYIPADKVRESVSKALEYTYNDYAIAHVADALGETDDAQALLKRSANYKNLFDVKTGFIRPKNADGKWAWPFDPRAIGRLGWRDYTESNAWQTTFGIMHDPKGLIACFGGETAFVEKLDSLFNQDSHMPIGTPPDVAGLVGQYAHGNEPCHHIAYLYALAGQPQKTQSRVHQLLTEMYDNKPDGLAGNEDCGQMSAWFILSSLGFYAVSPVSGTYVFGTPLFDRAEIDLANGKSLTFEVERRSPDEIYIDSIAFNGQPYPHVSFAHKDIANGGHFKFVMTKNPTA